MARSIRAVLALSIVLVASCAEGSPTATAPDGVVAFAKAPAQSNSPVTVTIADDGMQVRSDGLGAYTNANSLTSIIQSIGAWLLDSYNPSGSTRKVYLDFSRVVGSSLTTPTSGVYKVRMISKCNIVGANMLTMTAGQVVTCPLHIRFDYGGSAYALQMNPGASAGDPDGAAPGSAYAKISCLSGSPCAAWNIEPNTDGGNAAGLLKYTTAKGKPTVALQGYFTFSFLVGVTKS